MDKPTIYYQYGINDHHGDATYLLINRAEELFFKEQYLSRGEFELTNSLKSQ